MSVRIFGTNITGPAPPTPTRQNFVASMATTPTTVTSKASGVSTTISSAMHEPLDRNAFVAIVEGRGQARGEVGIAYMNLQTPNITLCQFTDTQSYLKVVSKMNIYRPVEILMSATSCDTTSPSQLYRQLNKELPNIRLVPIQRRIFNEGTGLNKLLVLAAEAFLPLVHSISCKYYCLAAAAALFKYVELVQSILFSSKSLRVVFQGSDQTCMIDHVTALQLELLVNKSNPGSGHSVFGILNTCKTPLGARTLRMNLLQPLCDEKLINSRLDSVQSLMNDREAMYTLQEILAKLPIDIEHVIASLVQIPKMHSMKITEQRISFIIALKQTLELLPGLARLLENSEDDYFRTVLGYLLVPIFDEMLVKIKRVVNEEAQFQKGALNMKRQRCFAVKAEVNPILDIARNAYCEIIEDINQYVIDLSRTLNINFRLGNSIQRGFYLQFIESGQLGSISKFPTEFIQVKKRGNTVSFTTEVLISSDHRAQEVLTEIENLSGIVVAELISELRSDIGTLYTVSEAIGNLDVILSLATYALTTPRCVRPTYTKDVTCITMGRHPILNSISIEPSVPNNTLLSNYVNFMLITGPNMSGKTTFIKQIAALQVMAQIGSFVPAEAAAFRIASNILSRLGTGDKIEENYSSFAVELSEMNYILQSQCDTSLIIIDEFGRATSAEEGTALSWALAEELLKTRAHVLFATHHLYLTKMESLYLNVMNYVMDTREFINKSKDVNTEQRCLTSVSKLEYTHMHKRGVTDVENYGLKFAKSTSFPSGVLERAMKIAKAIKTERGEFSNPRSMPEAQKKRNLYLLGTHVCLAARRVTENMEDISSEQLKEYCKGLQAEFRTMAGILPSGTEARTRKKRKEKKKKENEPQPASNNANVVQAEHESGDQGASKNENKKQDEENENQTENVSQTGNENVNK